MEADTSAVVQWGADPTESLTKNTENKGLMG